MLPQTTTAAADRRKQMYQRGPTVVYACRKDPRFSYCMYVPPGFDADPAGHTLIVAVHGTGRTMTAYRDGFSAFARYNKCVVLAPLFPVGVCGDDNADGFKYIREGDIRYDHVLLAMIEEAGARLGHAFGPFMLFGFSGGGHFVHRFFYLHPQRLCAVSIGAPGAVTLIDDTRDYWVGTRNLEALFGTALDLAAMRQVPVQMVVGAADIETWEIDYQPGSRNYMDGINATGRTRIERNTALRRNFEAHGIQVRQDIVPNVPHDGTKVLPNVQDFFLDVLCARRGGA
ncbi:alpha/beta hydrolase [Limobrevibacterium gyesilva]|uniref:Alpha/beta hydrolase n=1 Tax=Limobrevibacterium gyesilva TaxID=2991712 RepID=A0AA41YTP7_9PROT|nr:alpha/beta hydrolase [Limobrevibacterium gyesilva]MCW3475242.1 alpha/beta hydrolase [Limobrevibacterium gyesilva]